MMVIGPFLVQAVLFFSFLTIMALDALQEMTPGCRKLGRLFLFIIG